jgi:carboxypeptidase PM20D1
LGRGTVDTNITFNGVLSAANHLISRGFVPRQDIYIASRREEVYGHGAPNIVEWFKNLITTLPPLCWTRAERGEGHFPGIEKPAQLIGISEKKGNVEPWFKVTSAGGHASAPKPHTP